MSDLGERRPVNTDYAVSLLEQLKFFYEQKLLTDVVLLVEDTEFPCHKMVLATCSSYFRLVGNDRFDVVRWEFVCQNCPSAEAACFQPFSRLIIINSAQGVANGDSRSFPVWRWKYTVTCVRFSSYICSE